MEDCPKTTFLYIVSVYSEEMVILQMVKYCAISTCKMEGIKKTCRWSGLYVLVPCFIFLQKNYNTCFSLFFFVFSPCFHHCKFHTFLLRICEILRQYCILTSMYFCFVHYLICTNKTPPILLIFQTNIHLKMRWKKFVHKIIRSKDK